MEGEGAAKGKEKRQEETEEIEGIPSWEASDAKVSASTPGPEASSLR